MGRFELRRVPFFSAHRSVYGPVERGLCGFCLCLSSGVDESGAVLLPVLTVLANSKMSFVLSVNSSEFEQQNRFRQHYLFCSHVEGVWGRRVRI